MSLGEQSFFWQYPEVPLTEEESEYYQVNGQEMSSVFESMFTTGISPEFIVRSADDTPKNYIGSSLAVSAGEGLSVIVSPGSAMIKGHPYLASLPINIGVAEGITDILLQMNTTTDKPFISLISRPRSGGDIEDNVKREALIYELAIGTVEVPIGAIAVTPVMIKDHRLNMTLSPINKQPIAGLMQPKPNVGTLGIWEDWNKLDDYIKKSWADFIKQSTEAWVTYISGKNAEWEQIKTNVNGEFENLTSQFNTQITTNQSNFERWFSTLQIMLDGDVAAELAGKVAKLQADKANKADVYTKSEIDTKLTETNKSIATIKSTTYTKSETDLTRTYTLMHSKSGAVHTLTGLPTTNGIYQCQFVAKADYAEGETFADGYTAKPNGEETKLPNKAFVSGDIVSVTVDVGGKKLGFKIGGGGGYGTLSPQIKSFTAKAGNHEITLSWNNPSDSNFAGTYLVRKQGSMPTKLSDGTKMDVGKATSYTDKEPQNDKLYYYRAFPYNAKKQVQTELTGAVVNATPKAFNLPTYTGQHAIFGDETKGRIEIYSSGTLTLSEANYDLFVVGGGGGSNNGGGGGGYTKTLKNSLLNSNYTVSIGAYESSTEIVGVLSAQGGEHGQTDNGGSGGSGGGGSGGSYRGGNGGSDGGEGGKNSGGKGQGTTTRAFGETDGTLYAGGGGGFSGSKTSERSSGGEGGGGYGNIYPNENGVNGTPNTGGGGGAQGKEGGSGIAIVRWGY